MLAYTRCADDVDEHVNKAESIQVVNVHIVFVRRALQHLQGVHADVDGHSEEREG